MLGPFFGAKNGPCFSTPLLQSLFSLTNNQFICLLLILIFLLQPLWKLLADMVSHDLLAYDSFFSHFYCFNLHTHTQKKTLQTHSLIKTILRVSMSNPENPVQITFISFHNLSNLFL